MRVLKYTLNEYLSIQKQKIYFARHVFGESQIDRLEMPNHKST